MSKILDVLLLLALPASGKSEVRRYLASLTPEQCRNDMHMGPTVQLDDYPYVHMMRRVSQELRRAGEDGVFFDSDDLPMKESRDWGTLIELLNEDFDDLMNHRRHAPASASRWLLDRFDDMRSRVGAAPALCRLPATTRAKLEAALERDAAELLRDKNEGVPDSLAGRTVVMEFARGGPDGAGLPLPPPLGYGYSLARLSDDILERASILYVWVTPEESRRKNTARTDPNDPGSILHHGVPLEVMFTEYGCDDIDWMCQYSKIPQSIVVEAHGRNYSIPIAKFDNRVDKTSFLRDNPKNWKAEQVKAVHDGLRGALQILWDSRSLIDPS